MRRLFDLQWVEGADVKSMLEIHLGYFAEGGQDPVMHLEKHFMLKQFTFLTANRVIWRSNGYVQP
jgi:hypothetical protein